MRVRDHEHYLSKGLLYCMIVAANYHFQGTYDSEGMSNNTWEEHKEVHRCQRERERERVVRLHIYISVSCVF